jgi:hypothetical protein
MRPLLVRLATALLLTFPGGKLWAQIGTSRDSIVIDVARTRERFADIVVWNTGATELEASVRLQDDEATTGIRSASRTAAQLTGRVSCASRMTISPAMIRLGPGEQRTLRVVVDSGVLDDAECRTAILVQPTRVASRPLSTERTVPRSALVAVIVTPTMVRTTLERE